MDYLLHFIKHLSSVDYSYHVSIATLVVTLVGLIIAFRAYRNQIAMTEPWSMTKVGENLWLLERNRPKLATIYGAIGGELCDNYEIRWYNGGGGFPNDYFRKGTNILIETESANLGVSFRLYYKEHTRERYPFRHGFHPEMRRKRDLDVEPRGVKVWETSIY